MSRKIRRRIKKNKDSLPAKIDLGLLKVLFLKFCVKVVESGDIDKVGRIIKFMGAIKALQEKNLTYERAFILNHLERHGLLGEDLVQVIKDCPLGKEEAEELKKMFGDQIEEVETLMGDS